MPNNLPVQLTSFIGREAECASVVGLLADHRLVTLSGSGGCGKTRLSLRVASEVAPRFADGAWWIDLARLSADSLIANAIAAALAVKEVPGESLPETLKHHLRDQRALLLLDNCEHVVETCAHLAHELLKTCPRLSILTTSRQPLGVEGETSWRVPSLPVPDASRRADLATCLHSEAVRLFLDRASRVHPTFRLTDENVPAVAEICRRLDGIPLAIELAAARVRMMTPEQIVAGLEDRFRLLTGTVRTSLSRHQTLRASADWSHELLSEEERTVLRRLAVFSGGFTLEGAEEVCAGDGIERSSVLDIVARLLDRSLVHMGEETPAARYRLLETIRQYAAERLLEAGEEDVVRARHFRYVLSLAERAGPEMAGPRLVDWLHVFDVEHDNVRAAFDWGMRSGVADESARLMSNLWQFWFVRGHVTEGRQRFEAALNAGVTDPRLRATAFIDVGQLMSYHGDFVAARDFASEALKIARRLSDGRLEGRAMDTLGYATTFLDPPAASDLFRASASLLGDAGDAIYLADALNGLGLARLFEGDYAGARAALEEGVASSRRIGNLSLMTIGLGLLGYALELQGHLAHARTCLREALSIARRIRDSVSTAQALYCLGFIDAHRGEHEKARTHIEESVATARRASPLVLAFALLTDGLAAYMRAELDRAESALEEMLHLSADVPAPWLRAWGLALLGNVARVRGDLDGARVRVEQAVAVAKVGGMRVDVPIDAAGRLARASADFQRAESLHHEALAAALEARAVLLVPMQLEALAGLAALAASFDEATRLFGAAEAARDAHGLARYTIDQQEYEADVERARAGQPEERFRETWEQGRAMSLDDAVAYASRGRGERRRPSSGWRSLTPTEIQVVRHVAEGLTNPQIGARLFVSRSTVKVHLAHIFAKLGVATRSELAAAAVRHGLESPDVPK